MGGNRVENISIFQEMPGDTLCRVPVCVCGGAAGGSVLLCVYRRQRETYLCQLDGIFCNANTLGTLCYSLAVAVVTTAVCLLIAYPTAYILAGSRLKNRSALLLLFIMPMWINFSLRITALKEILTLIEGNLSYFPFLNAVIGMAYDFLPVYDPADLQHAFQAGRLSGGGGQGSGRGRETGIFPRCAAAVCTGHRQRRVHGIFAFHDNYVVLDMLYNSTYIMGSLIGSYFAAYNWNGGSMIALILLESSVCLQS